MGTRVKAHLSAGIGANRCPHVPIPGNRARQSTRRPTVGSRQPFALNRTFARFFGENRPFLDWRPADITDVSPSAARRRFDVRPAPPDDPSVRHGGKMPAVSRSRRTPISKVSTGDPNMTEFPSLNFPSVSRHEPAISIPPELMYYASCRGFYPRSCRAPLGIRMSMVDMDNYRQGAFTPAATKSLRFVRTCIQGKTSSIILDPGI
jgi:hypothetical protein